VLVSKGSMRHLVKLQHYLSSVVLVIVVTQVNQGVHYSRGIKEGILPQRGLIGCQKLMREQEYNSATLSEKYAKDKALSKMISSTQNASRHRKKKH